MDLIPLSASILTEYESESSALTFRIRCSAALKSGLMLAVIRPVKLKSFALLTCNTMVSSKPKVAMNLSFVCKLSYQDWGSGINPHWQVLGLPDRISAYDCRT